ncbi:hypothetical protein QQ045_008955 [Rhodiola kirilowii]
MIKAEYKASFHSQFALNSLFIPTPSSNIKGKWTKWSPSSTGLTLSLAVHKSRCGGILRVHTGGLVMGFKLELEYDDLIEGLISACLLLEEEGWMGSLTCIQSSHADSKLIGADNFDGGWVNFNRWREARKRVDKARIIEIAPEINDAAIAMCFQETSNHIHYNMQGMPKAVRVALISDYTQLPVWCRNTRGSGGTMVHKPRTLQPGSPRGNHHRDHAYTCPYV